MTQLKFDGFSASRRPHAVTAIGICDGGRSCYGRTGDNAPVMTQSGNSLSLATIEGASVVRKGDVPGCESMPQTNGNIEDALRLVIAQLTATLDATADGILVTDLAMGVTHVNRQFRSMWRIPPEFSDVGSQPAKKHLITQLAAPDSTVVRLAEMYARPDRDDFAVLKLKDGRVIEHMASPQQIDGHAIGFVHSFRDVSDRVNAERMQSALHRISETAHASRDLKELFAGIHAIIGDLLPARNFFVALYDPDTDQLSFPYYVDELDPQPEACTLDSGTLSGEIIRTGEALLLTPDTRADLPEHVRTIVGSDFLDWLGVPLQTAGRTFGALVVQSYSGETRYTERHRELLQFVSAQIASAIERKRSETALLESEQRYRLLTENSEDVIWTLDREGNRTYVSPAVFRLRGYTPEEVLQRPLAESFAPAGYRELERHLLALKSGKPPKTLQAEAQHTHKDGSLVWVEIRASCMYDAEGEFIGVMGITRDISERKQHEERVAHLAFHDPLTQLPNRTLFQDRLKHALSAAERHEHSVAVLFLDLDRFKEINDTLGHAIGDQALIEVARRLQATTRQEETLARLGGDEFVLIAEDATADAAALVATRMMRALDTPITVGGSSFSIGGSIGIALYPGDGLTCDELVRRTDIAMYRAKEKGGGFQFYQPEMGESLQKRLSLIARLTAAMEANELELYFQPFLCLGQDCMCGAEVLLRWHDGENGWVSPAEFIPIAEERGLMGPLGDWVLAASCRQLKSWHDAGLEFPGLLAVNVSATQLLDPLISSRLESIVRDAGLTPSMFAIEITETSMMTDPETSLEILEELSAAGFSLSIDDFGTGYSSLSYLKRFAVNLVKIDISFIRDMLGDRDDFEIVKAIIAMSKSLGLKTVAEGVEHGEQAMALTALGCDLAQGYHFDRPQSADVFAATWLRPSTPAAPG